MLKKYFLLIFVLFFSIASKANTETKEKVRHPFYVGVTGGTGATTWGNLVPKDPDPTSTLAASLPLRVSEGGKVWGLFVGYELIPAFALELSYMRYPNAKLFFDPEVGMISYTYGSTFVSRTSSISLSGKFQFTIPHSSIVAYSKFGAAEVHRKDVVVNRWRLSPTFGAGLDYTFNEHFLTELGTEYTAGYGQSELVPVNHYIPFLYSIFLRLGYRF